MPLTLLPASAAAFAPRSSPNIVLNSKVEPWMTATLKRINRIKRPLNNVTQHQRCLTETLSAPTAIWTLCSIMLPKAPDAELRRDDNPLIEALFNYQLLHIEAYVVHVDMVSNNEVAFKLTAETIDALVEYHKDIFSVDTSASTWNWSEKEVQLKKLQEDFVQAANKFVFRTAATALEGLEEDGAGELLAGGADDAKTQIMGLFLPLLPPPPRQPDIIRAAPILPSSTGPETWWPPSVAPTSHPHHAPQLHHHHRQEQWHVLPSSPSTTATTTTTTASADGSGMWSGVPLEELQQISSPASSYEPAYTSAEYCPAEYFSAPETVPMTVAMSYAPLLPTVPMPSSIIAQQCGPGVGYGGFGGFDWDHVHDFGMQYATTM